MNHPDSGRPERSLLVTGCSSGIGLACALGMKQRGWRVFATARKTADLEMLADEGLEAIPLDYRDPASIRLCADTVIEATGGTLLALFNNGAYGQPGAIEDLPVEALRDQFEVNVFGWHDLTRQLLPSMIANGRGRIVNCSSILGLIALKYRGAYNASKFALEGLTDTLRLEMHGTGIEVSLIEPGPITSAFRYHARDAFKANIDIPASRHRALYERRLKHMDRDGKDRFELGPEAVLEKLIHALESPRPKARYAVTLPTHIMAIARRLLPGWALHRLLLGISDREG